MEIPYRKLLIYGLTFLAYAYSGYGSNVLNNLRDAVLAAENVFSNVLDNLVNVAKKFQTVHDVFDAAVDEYCLFKCPKGEAPRKNRNHVPKSNGCGSLGIEITNEYLPINEMTKCCDAHDICYDTCNNDKDVCDMEFRRCLYRYCDTYENQIGRTVVKACKGAAKMLFTGTLTLGCKSFLDAQTNACYCSSNSKPKYKKYTTGEGEL